MKCAGSYGTRYLDLNISGYLSLYSGDMDIISQGVCRICYKTDLTCDLSYHTKIIIYRFIKSNITEHSTEFFNIFKFISPILNSNKIDIKPEELLGQQFYGILFNEISKTGYWVLITCKGSLFLYPNHNVFML